jgi:hypothetical protein
MSRPKTAIKQEDKKEDQQEDDFESWVRQVYDVTQVTGDDMNNWVTLFAYEGFNRGRVLRELRKIVPDVKMIRELVVLCSLRGPRAASQIKLSNGRTPADLGIPASGGKGSGKVTCARISAATADLAAFYMKKLNVPKRIPSTLPGWLQFPSAGSIKMPSDLAVMHREFSVEFSKLIGGVFNEQIYATMRANAYLDPKLALFEPP